MKRAVDLLPREMGMDPAEVRKKILIPQFRDGYEEALTVTYASENNIAFLAELAFISGETSTIPSALF